MLRSALLKLRQNKYEIIISFSLFLFAFAMRLLFLSKYDHPMMIHEQDGVGYMTVAKSFLNLGLPPVTGRPPGYPIIIALFALLPVSLEYAARLASIFMDAIIVFPLYYLARIFMPRLGAFVAALLWASFSYCLYFSTSPLSQSSCLCYLVFGVALLHFGSEKKEPKWYLFSGMMIALSFLARPEGIAAFGYGFLLCVVHACDKSTLNKNKLRLPLFFLLGFLLLAGPYLVAMRVALGGWTLSALTAMQVKGADAVLTLKGTGEMQKGASTGMTVWLESFGSIRSFLEAVYANLKAFVNLYLHTFPAWINYLAFFGFVMLAWKSARRHTLLLLFFVVAIAPTMVVGLPRVLSYIYPFFVLSFICFAYAIHTLSSTGKTLLLKTSPRLGSKLVEMLFAGVILVPIAYMMLFFYRTADATYQMGQFQALQTRYIFQGASEIIRDNSQPTDVIMTRWGLVGYFADRPIIGLPKGGVKEVVEYGRKNGARFLLIDTNSVYSRKEELMELLGPLEGTAVNPEYGIEVFNVNFYQNYGGYVTYRYK